ncbi:MAG TPA: hypothetical protein DIW23_03300 [Anaerolineae bacterium]|nr:hypothetical protein [Anaerolineae bacterium]
MGRELNFRQPISKLYLDTISIPQIITATKQKAVTEESKLAEAARDVQRIGEIALDRNQLKFPLEPFR